MNTSGTIKIVLTFVVIIALVVALSSVSNSIWNDKPEKIEVTTELIFTDGMTVAEFGQTNDIPNPTLKELFGLKTKDDLGKKLDGFGLSRDEIMQKVTTGAVLDAEHESKNWIKILIKFILWIAFLIVVFVMMYRGKIVPKTRKILYVLAVLIFGVIMGSDPSPMGTVKDAVALFASHGVIFPPRLIAMFVFLLLVFLANKFICAWGCQVGTLQDLIFRINRNTKDTKGIIGQYKIPFVISNTIRIAFFLVFTMVAFLWATDIFEYIDPFKIYKPSVLAVGGWIFLTVILIGSLFVYRPWCHLFCPFGLVGWLVEKISLSKITVNYETCVACQSCAKACPSSVMEAILKRDRVIPDCFACGTCIDVCPTRSISFRAGKREKPEKGKFETSK
jgi:polyferredoxin